MSSQATVAAKAEAPRKRMPADARRQTILDAALEGFSKRGLDGVSLDDVAERAGISKALIYEHFASKQELYANLLESHASELSDRLAAAVAGVEGSELRLETGLDAFFRFVEERREAWRILFR
jgi:AcrR family transcriptional regulator